MLISGALSRACSERCLSALRNAARARKTSVVRTNAAGTAGKYPYDFFYVGNGLFNSIVNKDFPTAAELTAIGTQASRGAARRAHRRLLVRAAAGFTVSDPSF